MFLPLPAHMLCVLQVNVYDLDAVGRLRPGGVVSPAAAAAKLGAARDIGWLPLPS